MLIDILKPYVTSFSEAIKREFFHGDKVVVGGVIVEIIDMTKWLPNSMDKKDLWYSLILDDGVGMNMIDVPAYAFKAYFNKHQFQKGDLVIAEGRVFQLEMEGHPESCTKILCWNVQPIPIENHIRDKIKKKYMS